MDVNTQTRGPSTPGVGGLARRDIGQILGAWQTFEVRVARGFPECRGLATEQLEDLYQETAIALLSRPYASEAHLRNALRQGIKHRALNLHRDQRRRGQILAEHAPSMHRLAEGQASDAQPETAAMHNEDRQVALGFLAELDPFEQQVFQLTAEGLKYRAIASRLGLPTNLARQAARRVERKRAAFAADASPADAGRHGWLGLLPFPFLTTQAGTMRRWLFGSTASGKAAAVTASAIVLIAGAVRASEQPLPHHAAPKRTVRASGGSSPRVSRKRTRRRTNVVRHEHRAVRVRLATQKPRPMAPPARPAVDISGPPGPSAVEEFGIEHP